MRNSMRKETAVQKLRDIRDNVRKLQRERVLELLQTTKLTQRSIALATNVARETVRQIKLAYVGRNTDPLHTISSRR